MSLLSVGTCSYCGQTVWRWQAWTQASKTSVVHASHTFKKLGTCVYCAQPVYESERYYNPAPNKLAHENCRIEPKAGV